MWYHGNGHLMGAHWIWWIIFLIVLIWIFLIPKDIPGQRNQKDSPMDILKKRYAKGEITKEEYDEMRKNLE